MTSIHAFELLIGMFLAVLVLQYVALRLRLPPAVALLVGGGALAFVPGLPIIELDPELVLVILLPPLLADGAWLTALAPFRRNLGGVVSLAVGAVLFTAAVVAVVTKLIVPGLPWAACVALGAIVSPPDAVSARAVLQRVKLPRRLMTLLEGESLLNDATGLVLFRFAVAAVLTGTFSFGGAVGTFAILVGGGILVGAAMGTAWTLLVRRLGDDHLMIVASVLVCWSSYLVGEALHVSGVIATVTAGLICGWNQHVLFTGSARLRGFAFWHVLIFLLEATVFILIGLSLRGVIERVGGIGVVIQDMAGPVVAIIAAVTLARFVWVFGADAIAGVLTRMGLRGLKRLGAPAATVMSWAGMRGVVTLAVALSLPDAMPGRDLMLVTAFAVILATVLVQGTTLGLIIRWANLQEDERTKPPLNLFAAEAAMLRAQLTAVERHAVSAEGALLHPQLLDSYRQRTTNSEKLSANNVADSHDQVAAHFEVILTAVAAGRAELVRLHRARQIDDETLHDLERDLDLEEMSAIAGRG
ncbi:Na+/H+ antiporter [Sphingobium lactosutens]|uniref:Na+/H+ antiporter n=1 Tax=Sphingobium lactosutens TaxID=522773 RepID=UPI0015B9B66D|nr:Na+/H+ antiporter [Sphingobium lactosutens]NWK98418.1 Na+/H+ antiporter [Sphingobium lactosutens]